MLRQGAWKELSKNPVYEAVNAVISHRPALGVAFASRLPRSGKMLGIDPAHRKTPQSEAAVLSTANFASNAEVIRQSYTMIV
jgi:hypothetical protein